MRNFKNNRRRYRSNSFDRGIKINSKDQGFNAGFGNVSDFKKTNYSRNNFNSPKLIQKYRDLAREALSSGDKILYENYLQHAEHFIRLSENTTNNSVSRNSSSENIKEIKLENINKDNTKQDKIFQAEES